MTDLRPGDDVFGAAGGAFAEYVNARAAVAPKPANLTYELAAAVPVAALTALQPLRDKGRLHAGQNVLINGASGGVGTFAVQIAKAMEADVTAVCGTLNVELVRSIGADRVIDYAHEDFTHAGGQYDLMIDIAGTKSLAACRRSLTHSAMVVLIGGPKSNPLLGPLTHIAPMVLAGRRGSQKVVFFIAKLTSQI